MLDKIKEDLKKAITEFTIEDFNIYTMNELYMQVANKTNEVIEIVKLLQDYLDEQIFNDVENIEIKQQILENVFNQLIINAGNSNAEIVDARVEADGTTHSKLGDRLNSIDSQIKEKANYTFVDVRQYGASGDGVTDDTESIQRAINYANSLSDNTTAGNLVKVIIPFGNYVISSIYMKRNVKLTGGGTLIVNGDVGIIMNGCLYNVLEDINIKLTKQSQIGISLQTDKDSTSNKSQLNNFNNVVIEGNFLKNTIGIKIGYSWVNTFNGCKIFRCSTGVCFSDYDCNSNVFYNCEIRHDSSNTNSIVGILHEDGKSNSFIGGVIENYHSCVNNVKGDFKLISVYTEAFSSNTPFILQGGSLTLDKCLLKGKFKILGGELLRIQNCEGYRKGIITNINDPLIQFFADVNTKVILENNIFPSNIILTKEGYYKDGSNWARMTSITNNKINDRKSIISYVKNATQSDTTGDGTVSTILFDEKITDEFNEYDSTTGVFTPLNGGLYRINVSVQLYHVRDTMYDNSLFIIESHGKSYKVDCKHGLTHSGVSNNELFLQGSLLLYLPANENIRINVKSTGGSKEVDVVGKNNSSIFSYLNIERIQ